MVSMRKRRLNNVPFSKLPQTGHCSSAVLLFVPHDGLLHCSVWFADAPLGSLSLMLLILFLLLAHLPSRAPLQRLRWSARVIPASRPRGCQMAWLAKEKPMRVVARGMPSQRHKLATSRNEIPDLSPGAKRLIP